MNIVFVFVIIGMIMVLAGIPTLSMMFNP
jgi:hypothetical protein